MGAESPFRGERENAIAAAERLAARHGMTLEEAAGVHASEPLAEPRPEPRRTADVGRFVHLSDYQLHLDKMRLAAAMEAARARGLDRGHHAKPRAPRRSRLSRARMNPEVHARILLDETSLPFREVASITGLDLYEVVGLKLKMRKAA